MAATAFHRQTGLWLTEISRDSKAGDEHTLSFASTSQTLPGRSSQFTHYTLSEPVAHNDQGYPLFDLNQCAPTCPFDLVTSA